MRRRDRAKGRASGRSGNPARRPASDEFSRRRRQLVRKLGGGVAVVPTAPMTFYSNDVENRYRAASDFYYLTGFDEPEAVAIIAPGNRRGAYWLLVRPRHPGQETWTGERAGPDGALRDHGAQVAESIDNLERVLMEILDGIPALHYSSGTNPAVDASVSKVLARLRRSRGKRAPARVHELQPVVHEMRLRKKPEEWQRLRRAAAITSHAHRAAMRALEPGRHEYEIQAVLEYEFRRHGAEGPAYPCIVGSGPNACVLHYTRNRRRMRRGELVLIDAGCEFDFYNADVTRTLPVGGRFSSSQRDLYDLVLAAQGAAMSRVRPGSSLEVVHAEAVKVLAQGMIDANILQGDLAAVLESGAYRRYYMHRTSHWLGMDVHDVGGLESNGRPRRLAAGMVLTVEPGIYIPPGDTAAPRRFRGVGIRIEDDVLVTASGAEVLTASLPSRPHAVERLVSAGS